MGFRANFARLTERVLTQLGEDSFLRDDVACKVNIEHGVQVLGEGGAVFEHSIATINKAIAPVRGDRLTHPDGEYVLDALFADNGFSVRYVLMSITP